MNRGAEKLFSYQDSAQPVEKRVKDLISRMTIEEKIAQLGGCTLEMLLENSDVSPKKIEEHIQNLNIGVLYNSFFWIKAKDNELNMKTINTVQKYLVENTRLGIPAIVTGEGVHGHVSDGATIFPHAIAMSCSWDPDLVKHVGTAIAKEASAAGTRQLFSPVLDLAREPRWGRTQETYGEDPYLAAQMGLAYITGIQGEDGSPDEEHVAATPKHFAAHGSPTGGINLAPVSCGERELHSLYLVPFRTAVCEAKALSVMNCYSEMDGVPAACNRKLLTEILRNEWGFRGYVHSDWGAIEMLHQYHHTASSLSEAGRQAIEAGVDVDGPTTEAFGKRLLNMVKTGNVAMSTVDLAVSRVLWVKFKLGLFENPYADVERANRVRNCWEHRELARKVAAESIVLLKNEGGLLPLSKHVKSIAVVGPNADKCQLGNYSGGGVKTVSLLEGIRNKISDKTELHYAEGCGIFDLSRDGVEEAVDAAREANAAIIVVGESVEVCEEGVDQSDLELPGVQMELVRAVYETKTPTVVVLVNGRPLAIKWIADNIPAILEAWFGGEEQGNAIADILFGDVNPSGKLTVSLPQSVGHIPSFYNCKPSGRGYYRKPGKPGKPSRDYVFASPWPLYEFGYGLRYTTFVYSELEVSPEEIRPNSEVHVSVKVKNTGKRGGSEVVQLYINDVVSSVTRPVKEIRGFKKVSLEPDEERKVDFTLKPEDLSLLDVNMNWVVEPGLFEVMVGGLKRSFTVLPHTIE